MVKLREPPFQSPSLAITRRSLSSHFTASGSRATVSILPVNFSAPSFLVSMPSSVTDPAEKCAFTVPVAPSTMAMWLFSCSVTTISPASLTSTNSGSGSSGEMAAIPVMSTVLIVAQSATPSFSCTIFSVPAGSCGSAPSFSSSSRSGRSNCM